MSEHRIFSTSFASVYPLYVQKAERKGRTANEVEQVVCWLTGYSPGEVHRHLAAGSDFRTFLVHAPAIERTAPLISGVVCGVRVEEVPDPLMRQIRCLDKLIDELAKGKSLDKILRR